MGIKEQIIIYLNQNKKASVENLRKEFSISRQIVHRHLKDLMNAGLITKVGSPPTVYYVLFQKEELPDFNLKPEEKDFLEKYYLWISPRGEMFYGAEGFVRWAGSVKQMNVFNKLVEEFVEIRTEANKYLQADNLIDATFKLEDTFGTTALEKLYYLDFYALPKYGKTPIGQLVLYAKQAQQEQLIKELVQRAQKPLEAIIKNLSIDAVAFIPPTIRRQLQFLKVFEDRLHLTLPSIKLIKAYKGQIPIAQKTLSKLEQRIENARDSIYIRDTNQQYTNVLLIDDAVGSGASMNEVAKKLLDHGIAQKVFGFSLVGSYKGFEVISEV